jgi:glycosyltransferase A (GT-A) superfamily protein (DUF2064 family)
MTTRKEAGTVVVVAKVPKASGGKSKTRLIPLLGTTGGGDTNGGSGTSRLATAMLMDVLATIDEVGACLDSLLPRRQRWMTVDSFVR